MHRSSRSFIIMTETASPNNTQNMFILPQASISGCHTKQLNGIMCNRRTGFYLSVL